MEENSNIDKVLMAYIAGEAKTDEIKRLLRWIDQSPVNREHFEIIQNYWKRSNYKISLKGQDEAFERIQSKIKDGQDAVKVIRIATGKYSQPSNIKWIKGIAAAIAFFALIFSIFVMKTTSGRPELTEEVPALMKFGNKPGQKSKIMLPDGSVVWLNSKSSIEYPKLFSSTERLVHLEGEAFFEVAQDSIRPFKVASGNVTTTALGTSFNVQFYRDDKEMAITLVSGKIKVSIDSHDPYFPQPGNQIIYNWNENIVKDKKIKTDQVIAWKNGLLIFDKDNYDDVEKKLERWYGVNIRTHGTPPSDFIVTGQIESSESLELALESLSYGGDFEYKINGKEIEIVFKPK
jgi:transmembrane sensor